MSIDIKLKRGLGKPSILNEGEPAFDKENETLYIGNEKKEPVEVGFSKEDREKLKKATKFIYYEDGEEKGEISNNYEENVASGYFSHAEGNNTSAEGNESHAEGIMTIAEGAGSHAEGSGTIASGIGSHSEGFSTTTIGFFAHAEGKGTIASGDYQHVEGTYNIKDIENKYAHIVGNGESDAKRDNAHTLDWDGNAWFAGDVKAGDISLKELNEKVKNNTGGGVGQSTDDDGEIFNLYEDTTYSYEGTTINVNKNVASGSYSHAEGVGTKALGDGSHAEGVLTTAKGINSHSEGGGTTAIGVSSHAEGIGLSFECDAYKKVYTDNKQYLYVKSSLNIDGINQLTSVKKNNVIWIETDSTNETGSYYIIQDEAKYSAEDILSGIVDGFKIQLNKKLPDTWEVSKNSTKKVTIFMGASCSIASHVEGKGCITVDLESTTFNSEGSNKQRQHAEGSHTIATGYASHSEGEYTYAHGDRTHVEGYKTYSEGNESHAEGNETKAIGSQSHAEGKQTTASGTGSHAEGNETTAKQPYSHVEGTKCETYYDDNKIKSNGHAEGDSTKVRGYAAHAEGQSTHAWGDRSHTEGNSTYTEGGDSHAEGKGTKALGDQQHVQGRYNIGSNKYAHIVGNGTDNDNRSNAHTLDWNGNAWFAGDILIGGTNQDDETAISLRAIAEYNNADLSEYAKINYVDTKDTEIYKSIVSETNSGKTHSANYMPSVEYFTEEYITTNGSTNISSTNKTSDYIYVADLVGKKITVQAYVNNAWLIIGYSSFAAYDESQIFIDGSYISNKSEPITVPDSATYIRIAINKAYIDNATTRKTMIVINEDGSLLGEYVKNEEIDNIEKYLNSDIQINSDNISEEAITEIKSKMGSCIMSTYTPIPKFVDIDTNSEFKLYFRNILPKDNLKFWIYSNPGNDTKITTYYYDDHLLIKPTVDGTYTLPWKVFDINSDVVDEGNIIINAKAKDHENISVLVLGDSTVNAGVMTQELLDLYSANNATVTLLGTRGTAPNLHEGRGGWTAEGYCTKESDTANGVNPFYNNGFDFSYYMENQGYPDLHAVVIQLGINDIFKYRQNNGDKYNSTSVLNYFDQIVDSILD